nr:MAG TPA: hypothetical protein [Caudoviricetes sp.]
MLPVLLANAVAAGIFAASPKPRFLEKQLHIAKSVKILPL